MSEAEAAERRAAYIARLIADAPPPTPEQVSRVRAALGDAALARRSDKPSRAA